jgi:hydroxyacylglutathione hydrolase
MGEMRIIQLQLGFTRPVLVANGDHSVLIDTGPPGKVDDLVKQVRFYGTEPGQIKLIILTHVHYDHTGNLEEIKKLTGAKVVVNEREAGWLHSGLMPIPRGTGLFSRIIVGLGDILMPGYASPRPFDADIQVDERLELNPWGVDGEVILTPGHTEGSQSVKIGTNLICGDTFFNFKWHSVYPPFANDPVLLLKTWERVLDMGIKTIYPGHGPRFDISKVRETYHKITGKRNHNA